MSDAAFEEYERTYAEWLIHPDLGLKEFFPQHQVIEGDPIVPINDFLTIDGLEQRIRESRETFFFHPSMRDSLPLDDWMLQGAKFNERVDWRYGRLESLHKVFFGELVLVADDSAATEVNVPVACKPYHSWVKGAVHEYASDLHINEMGFIEAFHPLGIWVDSDGNNFLLTHFEEEVKSLDNTDWSLTVEDPLRVHLNVFEGLELSAYALARWHSNGYAHRDGQVKNMAFDSKGIRAIDLEQLRRIQTPDQPDIESMKSHMQADLKDFMDSVTDLGFLRGDRRADQQKVVKTTFLSPYRSAMRHPSNMLLASYGTDLINILEDVCDATMASIAE